MRAIFFFPDKEKMIISFVNDDCPYIRQIYYSNREEYLKNEEMINRMIKKFDEVKLFL